MGNNRPKGDIWAIFLTVLVVFGILRITIISGKFGRNFYLLSVSLLVLATLGLIIMIVRSLKARR